MVKFFKELTFEPSIESIVSATERGRLIIFTGQNNSGKSAYLKKMIFNENNLYIGVNRFYAFHYLEFFSDKIDEKANWFHQMSHKSQYEEFQNFEGSFFNAATAITRLSDKKRDLLFGVLNDLFGTPASVVSEDPENIFSRRHVSVDGDSLSVVSSGTRLFLGLLAALMDDRFSTIAVDEPELGLSPNLQRKLADIVIRGERKADLFPHNPNIVLSTHSYQFLDRRIAANNWIVERVGDAITARRCSGFHELHDIQFRLLGNDLQELFLPDAVIFVEGDTDKDFITKILMLELPGRKVTIQSCGGDIAKRLTYWADSIGDMQLSPYRDRTFVVYDSVKQAGIERTCNRAGLPNDSKIEWTRNGIEFLYPVSIMAEIFRKEKVMPTDICISGDQVSCNQISYKKMELCRMVCDRLSGNTSLPLELINKLIQPLKAKIGSV